MQEITLNGEFYISYPEGFHEMGEEEKSKLNTLEGDAFIGLSDPARHILVTAGSKHVPGWTALFTNGEDLAKNMEKHISKPMKAYGYRLEGFTEKEIAGSSAEGFTYTYTAQGTPMYGESFVLRKDKTLYYFHFYVWDQLKENGIPLWEEILASVRTK